MSTLFCIVLLLAVSGVLAAPIAKVSYTPLSEAARKNGSLAAYEKAPQKTGTLKLGEFSLRYQAPQKIRAYDTAPIKFELNGPAASNDRRVAVEGTAFEDPAKAGKRALYDLAIPGDMSVKMEYLGSVTGHFDPSRVRPLTPDGKSPAEPFPPYKLEKMVRSGVVKKGNVIWFKVRFTNTGDTILDPEGFGAACLFAQMERLDDKGQVVDTMRTVNQYERFLNYLYPGESSEHWIEFFNPKGGAKYCRGLTEGKYRLKVHMLYRYHRNWDYWINIWHGGGFATLEVPVEVKAEAEKREVQASFKMTDEKEKMPGYIDKFEEFMTAFRIVDAPANSALSLTDTIYLQVAPWTKEITLKLIATDPREIAVVRIPVEIDQSNLAIRYNPKNPMVLVKDGREEPVIAAQAMPGMRTGFQLGPHPEKHMRDGLKEMKDLGINVIINTAGNWQISEVSGRNEVELHSACYKHFYDVLCRELDMTLMGWSVYPPWGNGWTEHAASLLGRRIEPSRCPDGAIDLGDPAVPEVIAAWAFFNHRRWGDMWFRTKDGRVPVDIEDTWGWMRDDINIRHIVGPRGLELFHEWLKEKYGDIGSVNRAWGTDYASFDEIDPNKDQGEEGDGLSCKPVYNNPNNPFHDWTPAVEDWDTFRTKLRCDIYRKATELIHREIPGAELELRTEGANLPIPGSKDGPSMHMRHVYHSQRRNAMVYDVLKKEDVIHFHSDYTTLPYSEAEWRKAMRQMVKDGIIPVYLPQFDHMRDILINDHYGRNYQTHYELAEPKKGMMIHCLMAAYPWWRATYEEGGAPGIIWSDYLCDGFATETQKREVKLLRKKFNEMIDRQASKSGH